MCLMPESERTRSATKTTAAVSSFFITVPGCAKVEGTKFDKVTSHHLRIADALTVFQGAGRQD